MRLTTHLRTIREERGLTIREAEEQTGIARGTLSQLERGVLLPLDKQVPKLEIVYGPSVDWYSRLAGLALQEDEAA